MASSPQHGEVEDLDSVRCTIYPRGDKESEDGDGFEKSAIEISRADGRVQLEYGALRFWLGGREVEAYECA